MTANFHVREGAAVTTKPSDMTPSVNLAYDKDAGPVRVRHPTLCRPDGAL